MAELHGSHYVYLYREPLSDRVKYIGYGHDPDRAMSHAGASHNEALRAWLDRGNYALEIAGPYRDSIEGLAVEAALISGLHPEFNVAPGSGPRFHPLGVPPELADRVIDDPIRLADVGPLTGGALVVYITSGDLTKDGRRKPNPTAPDPEAIALNAESWWQIGHHVPLWRSKEVTSPHALIAAYGANRRHRFVIGSFEVDPSGWTTAESEGSLWKVPLVDRAEPDAFRLRGRRIDVSFGRARWEHYRWVDSAGQVRPHSPPA